ncbi:MAG: Na/Pi cotransporter family protein [Lachnospiraceae bacterium]|nr:Na/Pi cotransporter family protein [Lachnospiraceae bacterium]
MTIFNFISALGGVGLFLFGMSLMGQYLEKVAGAKLENLLEKLTSNRVKGFSVGILVTVVIQSSAATTIMALGFVNAGIMKLVQAIPVAFGANIGSTITGQILRLNEGMGDSLVLQLLKPSTIAPVLVCACALIQLISKNKKLKDVTYILMGFGILFIGMNIMEDALSPLSESEEFRGLFTRFTNPILGMLVGMIVTMALQSSSASVGILQALALSTGTLTFSSCLPIIVGQNVGKCITVVLGSLGTSKKAQRLAVAHVLFNVIGAIVIMTVMYTLNATIGIPFWEHKMGMGNIADVHTLFNVITSLMLLPFVQPIANLTGKIIKGDGDSKMDKEFALLDDIFLDRPAIALEQANKVINAMYDAVNENYRNAIRLLTEEWDEQIYQTMEENENFLDKSETVVSDYLVRVTSRGLTSNQRKHASEMLNSVSDLERMGDYCIKIADVVTYNNEQGIRFSKTGLAELQYMINAVQQALDEAMQAFRYDDTEAAYKVEPLVVTVKGMSVLLREHHTARLQAGDCSTQAGISLMELVNCFERISSHASNVTLQMLQKINNSDNFDLHEVAHAIRHSDAEADKALMQYYENMYMTPVVELGQAHKALFKWADDAEVKTKKITELTEEEKKLKEAKESKKKLPDKKKKDKKSDDSKSKKASDKKDDKSKAKDDKAKSKETDKSKDDKAKAKEPDKAKEDKAKAKGADKDKRD